jgi:hypothetical protein
VTRSVWLAALGALVACAGSGGVPSEALHDPYTERLVMAPYPPEAPWPQVTDRHTREGTLLEWAPPGNDPERPTEVLGQQVLFGPRKAGWNLEVARCRSGGAHPGTEDGNDVRYEELTCEEGSAEFHKIIYGHEALYDVFRRFSHAPSAQERRAIDAYLRDQVYLCPIAGGIGRCARR